MSQWCSVIGYESKCNSQKSRPCCMLFIILTLCSIRLYRLLDLKDWCQMGYPPKKDILNRDTCFCFQITLEKWVTYHTNADAFYYSQVIIKCSFFLWLVMKVWDQPQREEMFQIMQTTTDYYAAAPQTLRWLDFSYCNGVFNPCLQTTFHQSLPCL